MVMDPNSSDESLVGITAGTQEKSHGVIVSLYKYMYKYMCMKRCMGSYMCMVDVYGFVGKSR